MPSSSTSSYYTHLALLAFFSSASLFFLHRSLLLRRRRVRRNVQNPNPKPLKLLFASTTGTSKSLASSLHSHLASSGIAADLVDVASFEPEDLTSETLVLFVISTWENGAPPPSAAFLARWLGESAADFRVGSLVLSNCRFAVFGVGSSGYGEDFNAAARSFSKWMRALGAVEIAPVEEADVDGGDLESTFGYWSGKIVRSVKGEEVVVERVESDAFDGLDGEEDYGDDDEDEMEEGVGENVEVDMEDIAGKAAVTKKEGGLANGGVNGVKNGVRDMVTPIIRTSLEKQVICFSSHLMLL